MRWLVLLVCVVACKKESPLADLPDAAPRVVQVVDAAPEIAGDAPGEADCRRALARVKDLSAAATGADHAADLADCLAMPRSIVICLAEAADMEAADRCVGQPAAGAPEAVPPETQASAADCAKVTAHMKALPAEGDEKAEMSMLAACREELTESDIECLLAARTRAAARACLSL